MFRPFRLTASLPLLFFFSFSIACTPDEEGDQKAKQTSPYCKVERWECAEFEPGPQLSKRRHGHQTVVLDADRVLLIGGLERPEGGGPDQYLDTCEIVNIRTGEVHTVGGEDATRCFRDIRRDPHLVKLQDGSVLAMAGFDGNATRLKNVERFDPQTEEWTRLLYPLNIDYQARQFTSVVLEDGRVFLLREDVVRGQHNPSKPGGEIFDPETERWTPLTMPDIPVDTIGGALIPGTTQMVLVLGEPDALTKNPPPPENENEEPLHPGHLIHLGIYDIETETWEKAGTLPRRGTGMAPQLVWVPDANYMLIEIPGDMERPSYGFRFDPESKFFEEFFERTPIPGQLMTVLPGDQVLFHNSFFTQLFDIERDTWWEVDAYPEGMTYSSLVQLEDCRLFASGERPQRPWVEEGEEPPPLAELRGQDTAICSPVLD